MSHVFNLRHVLILLAAAVVAACGRGNPENSAVCGFTNMAGATRVLDQLRVTTKVLSELPAGVEGTVPARVVGYGTARALAGSGPEGAVLGYEGPGFPPVPGFGLILVEDSTDTFQGVLIYEIDPPPGYPQLGTISSATTTIPVYGLRVIWSAVSDRKCPLFGPIDTTRS